MYYVIHNSEGEVSVEVLSKEIFLARLKDEWYGSEIEFFDSMPDKNDTNYWGNTLMVIKGEIVTPKPIMSVIEYDID
jgi:hypothetical protein